MAVTMARSPLGGQCCSWRSLPQGNQGTSKQLVTRHLAVGLHAGGVANLCMAGDFEDSHLAGAQSGHKRLTPDLFRGSLSVGRAYRSAV
jgi:hypothetical protein